MLRENTLFGVRDKVEIAIERIRMYEPPEGYFVAFSGGKDSVTVLDLVKRAGVKYDAHYNLTTVDPPELVRFIREQYSEVSVDKPETTMWELIPRKLFPPTQLARYCCEVLKERNGQGRRVVTGVRWEESVKRSRRMMVEQCFRDGSKTLLHPIIDWSEQEVWEYIKTYNVSYSQLYHEGYRRLGCIMCPMKGPVGMERDAKRWPKYKASYLRAFGRMLERREERGLETQWQTPEEVMEWWIHGKEHELPPDQGVLFE